MHFQWGVGRDACGERENIVSATVGDRAASIGTARAQRKRLTQARGALDVRFRADVTLRTPYCRVNLTFADIVNLKRCIPLAMSSSSDAISRQTKLDSLNSLTIR